MSKRASLEGMSFLPTQETQTSSHPIDKISSVPNNQVVELPVESIVPDPEQPRKHFDSEELKQLANSIAESGLLQPITVRLTPNGSFQLIAGERRWRAHQLAKTNRIRAIVSNIEDEDDAFELSLIENTQRNNLTPLEEAEGLANLMRRKGYSQKKAGEIIGRDPTQASRLVKLSKIPASIKKKVATSQLSRDQLFQISSQPNAEAMDRLLEEITDKQLNVRETRQKAKPKPSKKQQKLQVLQKLRSSHTFLRKPDISFEGLAADEKQKAMKYLETIHETSKVLIEKLKETS